MGIRELSKKEIIEELENENSYLCYIPRELQDKDIIITGVKIQGSMLQYAAFQDEDICLQAVRNNGIALEFVKEQTKEICFEAIKQNGQALEFVEEQNQDEEICFAAVKQCGWALEYASIQTDEICKAAVRHSVFNVEHIKIPVSFDYQIHEIEYASKLYAAKVNDTWMFGWDYIRDKNKEEFIEIFMSKDELEFDVEDKCEYEKQILDILSNY